MIDAGDGADGQVWWSGADRCGEKGAGSIGEEEKATSRAQIKGVKK